jgi:hypothetical protein
LEEVGEDARFVERGERGDHADAITVETEREGGGDGDAIENFVGVLDPLLGVETELGGLVGARLELEVLEVSSRTSSEKPAEKRESGTAFSLPRGEGTASGMAPR